MKCDVVSRVIISKKVFWSAVFVEAVFESSFGFTWVLFGAVVVLYHVNGIFGVTISN